MKIDFLNIYATIILLGNDALFYGYLYEIKGWFKKWLFYEWTPSKETYVPFYRLFVQWPLDGLALYLVWMQGWVPFIGMLLAWFCQVKEGGFYTVLNQWKDQKDGADMYWLNRPWFSEFWFYNNKFTVKKFAWSCIIGFIILIISNFIGG